jgi:hypothetical protein
VIIKTEKRRISSHPNNYKMDVETESKEVLNDSIIENPNHEMNDSISEKSNHEMNDLISDKPIHEMNDLISENPNHEIAGQEVETFDDKMDVETGESGDSDDYDSDNSDSSIFELSESSPRRSSGDKHMLKQGEKVSVSPNDIDTSKNSSTDDEISDASIIEGVDESMNLETECLNFLDNYESSFNNKPNLEPIETSDFESEKIPTNPTFLHCNICKNKHTRFLTQTELDNHMTTFHVQKMVNGFKVVSLSKNNMEGTKEIVFENF